MASGNTVPTHLLIPLTHIPSGEWEYCTYSPTYPSHLYPWWQVGILYSLTYLSLSLVSLMPSGNTVPTHLLIPLTCIPGGKWEYCSYSPTFPSHLYPWWQVGILSLFTYLLSLSLASLVVSENMVPTHLLIPLMVDH